MDEWGCFPSERQRLFDLIQTTKARGVLLLTGNVHFAEISKVETKVYPLFEFTSSGLTHINELYASADNEYRVAGPLVELNFGLVEIDWSAKPSTLITLNAVAFDGSTAFSHRISINQLQGTAK
jgi:alkaline phosphatase D